MRSTTNFDVKEKVDMLFKSFVGFPSTNENTLWYNETAIPYNSYLYGNEVFIDDIPSQPQFSEIDKSSVNLQDSNFAVDPSDETKRIGKVEIDTTGTILKFTKVILEVIPGIGSTPTSYYLLDQNGENILKNGFQFNTKWPGGTAKKYYSYTLTSKANIVEGSYQDILPGSDGGNWIYDYRNGVLFFPDYDTVSGIVSGADNKRPIFTFCKYIGRKGTNKLIDVGGTTPSRAFDKQLFVNTGDNTLYRYDKNGESEVDSAASIKPSPAFDKQLFVDTANNTLYRYDKNGEVPESEPASEPEPVPQVTVFTTENNNPNIPGSTYEMVVDKEELTRDDFPDGVTVDNLVEVNIGHSKISRQCFQTCLRLKKVTISTHVREIEQFAFALCSALQDVYILSNQLSIHNEAFRQALIEFVYMSQDTLDALNAQSPEELLSFKTPPNPDTDTGNTPFYGAVGVIIYQYEPTNILSSNSVRNRSDEQEPESSTGAWIPIGGGGGGGSGVPIGTVIAWHQVSGQTIPTGWALCDGTKANAAPNGTYYATNPTPDLRGRFILGDGDGTGRSEHATTNRDINSVGGEEEHTLTVNEMPRHAHGIPELPSYDGGQRWQGRYGTAVENGEYRSNLNNSNTYNTGGNQAHNNMPPYYVLVYIIKVA